MKCTSIARRVRKLEKMISVNVSDDDWIETVSWEGNEGGIFGHVHWLLSPSRREQQLTPSSDEEEVEIMRHQYENDHHRFFGQGAELSFVDYLERFCYLGSEELSERRNAVIGKVRSDGEAGR